MRAADVRWLFAYDRCATRRVLAVLDGVDDDDVWGRTDAVGVRGLGSVLVNIEARVDAQASCRPTDR